MIRMILKAIRPALGFAILFWERNFPPRILVERSPELHEYVKKEASKLMIYEFKTCPFCVKVRREMQRLGVTIIRLDVQNDQSAREELLRLGTKIQVPCLRIETSNGPRMLYESKDIIAFLRSRFGNQRMLLSDPQKSGS